METSKLYELEKQIKECERKMADLAFEKEEAKKEIEELLKKNFNRLRDFIAAALYKGLDEETRQKIDARKLEEQKKAEERKRLKRLGVKIQEDVFNTTTYAVNAYFDPFIDRFEIYDCKLSDDEKNIKIRVEDIKNSKYLGITGARIPELYETVWISIEDLIKEENATTSRLISF